MKLDIQNLRLDPAIPPLAPVFCTRPAIIHAVGVNVSLFFQAIMGLIAPSQGSITWNNTLLSQDRQSIKAFGKDRVWASAISQAPSKYFEDCRLNNL
jgi:hypothetical protein